MVNREGSQVAGLIDGWQRSHVNVLISNDGRTKETGLDQHQGIIGFHHQGQSKNT